MMGRKVSLGDVLGARRRIGPYLSPTPLLASTWLSAETGASVFLKIESVQWGRSFKIRGALNAALELAASRPADQPTLVTASAGNHGQALAVAAERLGWRAVVFTPRAAPQTKKMAIRRHGAELRDDPPDYDAAEQEARAYAAGARGVYISPYNHPSVIAGAGTIALELLERVPDLDVVVLPVGGGGLASGVALTLKAASPRLEVVGVEVEASTPFATSLAHGRITTVSVGPSLADGLTGNLEPDAITFDLVRQHVDRLVTVAEQDLVRAIRHLVTEEHLIAEGAGAAATAAVLTRDVVPRGRRAAVLVTGGNIDLPTLTTVLGSANT
ncbi:MAG: threonine ammonia-lyase [Acidobacteriota bacterium]